MDKIMYRGKKYATREINIPTYGMRTISVDSLEDVLLSEAEFSNPEARRLDDSVFFYIPDNLIEKPEKELSDYVYKQVA